MRVRRLIEVREAKKWFFTCWEKKRNFCYKIVMEKYYDPGISHFANLRFACSGNTEKYLEMKASFLEKNYKEIFYLTDKLFKVR